jgi:hypothetical protein
MVSYDLNSPGKNYQALWDALGGIGATRVLLSQWITRRSGTTAVGIRDYLRPFIDSNDRIMVNCLDSSDWAGWNLMVDPNGI